VIVLDASAAVELLVEEGEVGEWVAETVAAEPIVGAPHLIDLEVLSTLRRLLGRGQLTPPTAQAAVVAFERLRLVRYPLADLMSRIWDLGDRLTPYDASYVVLAEIFDAPLLTTDARLARAGGHRARIVAYDG
jgi:predicted nucleic acid-binding protein